MIQDEYHVILICPKKFDIRIKFTSPKYYTQPSVERFYQLIITKMQMSYVKYTAAFVHHVVQRQSAPELVFAPYCTNK